MKVEATSSSISSHFNTSTIIGDGTDKLSTTSASKTCSKTWPYPNSQSPSSIVSSSSLRPGDAPLSKSSDSSLAIDDHTRQ